MNKIKNLHDVSALYFFIFALAYVFMVLSFRNGYLAEFFLSIMRILDIPFAFIALLYGGTTLALQLNLEQDEESGFSPWILVIFAVSLLLFALVIFVNFAFPSAI